MDNDKRKKMKFEPRMVKICVLVFITAAAILIFNKALNASENLVQTLGRGISGLVRVLNPFIIALVIAYILNPATNAIEGLLGKLWRKEKHARARQIIALALTYLLVLGLLATLIYFTIPQMVSNISDIVKEIPRYYEQIEALVIKFTEEYPLLQNQYLMNTIEQQFTALQSNLLKYLEGILGGVVGMVTSTIGKVVNAILGVVLSFYLLNEKRSLYASCRRLSVARLGEARTGGLFSVFTDIDTAFGRYISSKLLESLIIYALAQIALSLLGVRFNVLFSVIIAVTNLVPYIGPVVGAIPPILVSLLTNPMLGLYTGIVIVVIQALDAYIIAPVLTGGKTGISPFWAMFATLLGGNLFGMWGLLLAVPVTAVLALFIRRYINRQAERRNQAAMASGKAV